MRKFVVRCIDEKTGYEMILCECTYNNAMFWLENLLRMDKLDIEKCEYNESTGLTEIWTAKYDGRMKKYYPRRRYFWDEERQYLLGE